MFKTVISLFVAAVAVAVLGVTDASATTFCVPSFHAGCANDGFNVAQASLETAMSTNASDGVADTVKVDGVELTDADSFNPSGSDQLTVEGVGAATRLTSSSNGNLYVVNLANGGNTRAITMRKLTIVVPASMTDNGGAAAQLSGDRLESVDIESRNPGASALPSWLGGGTFSGGRIYSAGAGSFLTSIRADANATAEVTIEGVVIDHPLGVAIVSAGATAPITVRGVYIKSPGQGGITSSAGTIHVENTVIESAATTSAIYAFAGGSAASTITADHITAVSAGGNASALESQVAVGQAGNASLTVTNSILRGYANAYLRSAPTNSPNGNADLTLRYSNFHVSGSEVNAGDGSLTASTGNIDADPKFVAAGDYMLLPGSPSIDAGDPAAGLTTDFLGAPRPVDGDAVAGAIRDQGAYEVQQPAQPPADPPADPSDPPDPSDPADPGTDPNQPPNGPDTSAPDTIKGGGPKAKLRKKAASFGFSSEAGATFRCELDGKSLATCASPLKLKHLKRGKHLLAVAAVDAAGNADPTPATWKFRVVRKHRAH